MKVLYRIKPRAESGFYLEQVHPWWKLWAKKEREYIVDLWGQIKWLVSLRGILTGDLIEVSDSPMIDPSLVLYRAQPNRVLFTTIYKADGAGACPVWLCEGRVEKIFGYIPDTIYVRRVR